MVLIHVMGARLGVRTALWCGIAACLLELARLVLIIIPVSAGVEGGGAADVLTWVHTAVTTMPWAIAITGGLGIARERGVLPAPHAFTAAVVAMLAYGVATVAAVAWAVAFGAADVGAPVPAFGRLDMPLFVTCGVLGALAAAVVVDGVLSLRTRLSALPRAAAAAVAGTPAVVATGITIFIPIPIIVISVVLIALSLVLGRRGPRRPPTQPISPFSRRPRHADSPEHPGSRAFSREGPDVRHPFCRPRSGSLHP